MTIVNNYHIGRGRSGNRKKTDARRTIDKKAQLKKLPRPDVLNGLCDTLQSPDDQENSINIRTKPSYGEARKLAKRAAKKPCGLSEEEKELVRQRQVAGYWNLKGQFKQQDKCIKHVVSQYSSALKADELGSVQQEIVLLHIEKYFTSAQKFRRKKLQSASDAIRKSRAARDMRKRRVSTNRIRHTQHATRSDFFNVQ